MFVFNEKWYIIRKNNSAFCILHYALFIVQQNDKPGFRVWGQKKDAILRRMTSLFVKFHFLQAKSGGITT